MSTTMHDTTPLPEVHETTRKEQFKRRISRDYHHWSYNPLITMALVALGVIVTMIIWWSLQSPVFIRFGWLNLLLFIGLALMSIGTPLAFLALKRRKHPPTSATTVVSETTDSEEVS